MKLFSRAGISPGMKLASLENQGMSQDRRGCRVSVKNDDLPSLEPGALLFDGFGSLFAFIGFCFGRGFFFSLTDAFFGGIRRFFNRFSGDFPDASTNLDDNAVHYHNGHLLNGMILLSLKWFGYFPPWVVVSR